MGSLKALRGEAANKQALHLSKDEAGLLVQQLLQQEYLQESRETNYAGFTSVYLAPGEHRRVAELFNSRHSVLQMGIKNNSKSSKSSSSSSGKKAPQNRQELTYKEENDELLRMSDDDDGSCCWCCCWCWCC
jgi:hypothetical protein